jgi:hypothetical protein
MYSIILLLGTASLIVTSTAHAQSPERALLSRTLTSATGRPGVAMAPVLNVTGERALLAKVESHARPADPVGVTDVAIDGAGALLGKSSFAISVAPRDAADRSRSAAIESPRARTARSSSWLW